MPSWCAATWAVAGRGPVGGRSDAPLALADLGLIDEYEFLVQPVLAGRGATCSHANAAASSISSGSAFTRAESMFTSW